MKSNALKNQGIINCIITVYNSLQNIYKCGSCLAYNYNISRVDYFCIKKYLLYRVILLLVR